MTITRSKPSVISQFTGQNRFLSNFYPAVVDYDGDTYKTVEHAYQAAKTMDLVDRSKIARLPKPGQAKAAGGLRGFYCEDCKGKGNNIKRMEGFYPHYGVCSSCNGIGQIKITLRPDWESIKLGIMEALVFEKFRHAPLLSTLLATGDVELIEGNHWNDTFWGVYRGRGENHLG